MNNPELKQFIEENKELFWYIPKEEKQEVSHEFLVETILNYGSKDAVIRLFNLLGIDNVAKIFFASLNHSERRKGNYNELTINFFTHVFNKYTH